jgi:hypothetical protein
MEGMYAVILITACKTSRSGHVVVVIVMLRDQLSFPNKTLLSY